MDEPMTVKIVDSLFSHENSIGFAGENSGRHPEHLRWDRTSGGTDVRVFSGPMLSKAVGDPSPKKIGLLLESPLLSEKIYAEAMELRDEFQIIFTHNKHLVEKGRPFLLYPLGGSWIKEWSIPKKTRLCSILVSAKNKTAGHKLRHEIVSEFASKIDVFGEPYTERLETKRTALEPYMFSIIVENGREDWYFTEKLIDCLSLGTIPIYWGCPGIDMFLPGDGIFAFHDIDQLSVILDHITAEAYLSRINQIYANFATARNYACPEDWIVRHYPKAFLP